MIRAHGLPDNADIVSGNETPEACQFLDDDVGYGVFSPKFRAACGIRLFCLSQFSGHQPKRPKRSCYAACRLRPT